MWPEVSFPPLESPIPCISEWRWEVSYLWEISHRELSWDIRHLCRTRYWHVIIIDGLSMVNTLSPRSSRKFEKYATFYVFFTMQVHSAKHKMTDSVFDVYNSNSVKTEAKSTETRTWVRWRVSSKCEVPSNWRLFRINSEGIWSLLSK